MPNPADLYAQRIDAVNAQRARLHGPQSQGDTWAGASARRFRHDPRRELNINLTIIASYLEPEDVLIDVGGGAGRIGLPLALGCREVINVEPSAGMATEFEASRAEAGITNARLVPANWLEVQGIQGDITIACSVTYFVRDIVLFVEKMQAAARRRVIISLWSVPNPYQSTRLHRLVYGEEQERVPGHQELLPVLWDLGILPDVRVMPGDAHSGTGGALWEERPQTREEAVLVAMQGRWLAATDRDRARDVIEAHFSELFAETPEGGFRPRWRPPALEMLLTWETSH